MTKPSKKYCLVLFLDDDCDKKSVDVVPTDWLFCDKRGSIYCPFIDDFTSSNISLLEKLVRDRKPPNDAWKTYRVDVRGHADTYKEAIKHLEKLKTEPYAFSTDNEDRIKEKQDKIRKQCRLKGVQNKQVDALTSSTAALDKPLEFKKKLADMLHGQPNTSDEDSSVSNSFDEINSVSSDLEPAVQKKISVLEDGNNVTFGKKFLLI
ncbi:hypothetical protein FQR65_LT13788 [Abscondita terminalis]|nr:hypothetical protein FQR65_LT13788 [Abscondita terminalis]